MVQKDSYQETCLVLNLTREKVVTYNSEGCLIELFPIDRIMEYPKNISIKAILVEDGYYDSLTSAERRLNNFVRIRSRSKGRNEKDIVTIESRTRRTFSGKLLRVFPASKSLYREFDPDNIVHQVID